MLSLLRPFRAVFRAALLAVLDALRIENAAQDVITNTGKVAHTATANEHDRVLLQVVPLAGDIGNDFTLVGQTHLGNLAQSGVRLLRRGRVNTRTDTALLRIGFH